MFSICENFFHFFQKHEFQLMHELKIITEKTILKVKTLYSTEGH